MLNVSSYNLKCKMSKKTTHEENRAPGDICANTHEEIQVRNQFVQLSSHPTLKLTQEHSCKYSTKTNVSVYYHLTSSPAPKRVQLKLVKNVQGL